MTNKLTKNDRLKSQSEKHDVAVAAFDALLSRQGVRIDYYARWANNHTLNYGDTIEQQWRDWASKHNPISWLPKAFVYHFGHIPCNVWIDTEIKWLDWISDNLNK